MLQDVGARILEAFDDPHQLAGAAVVAVSCLAAVFRGGRAERLAALVFTLAYLLSVFAQDLHRFADPRVTVFAVDVVMLAFLVALAFRSDRWWVLFAAGFQGLAVLVHIAIIIDERVLGFAYSVGLNLTGYLVFGALTVGALMRPASVSDRSPASPSR